MGAARGKIEMSDNEDWRHRKAEELGLGNAGPWPTRPLGPLAPDAKAPPPRAPGADAARAAAPGRAGERGPAPPRLPPEIANDAAPADRGAYRGSYRGVHPAASSLTALATARAAARADWGRHNGRGRPAIVLAIAAVFAIAMGLGWWLRGVDAIDHAPLAVPNASARSSAAKTQATGPEMAPMAETIPEPALDSILPDPVPPAAYDSAAVPGPPAASPPARYARAPLSAGNEPATRPNRATAPRGRFTAPRAVAAPDRDFRPSFNCRRATSWVNRTVCNSRRLAAIDVRMSNAYGTAIAAVGPAGDRRIDADQARFLQRRARCRTAVCIDRAYRFRIIELGLPN